MLVSRRVDRLQLITQPEHAALAGRLGERFGNERFPMPRRRDSLLMAAYRHDDGWQVLDDTPVVAEGEGRPAHFLEVSFPDTIEPYGAGIDGIYADDPYAGVLGSMHWAGLYSSRWGTQDSPPIGHPLAQAVVDEQETRWTRAARALWGGSGLRSEFERDLWLAYEVLQGLDQLSLALCLMDTQAPTDDSDEALPVPATLRDIDQPRGPRLVPQVPVADGHADLVVRVVEAGVVEVDPYPFDRPSFDVEVGARWLEDDTTRTTEAAASAYRETEIGPLSLTIVSPSS